MRHDPGGIRILRENHTPRGRVNIRRGPAAGLVGRPLWRRDQAQEPGGGAWIWIAVPGAITAASNVADAISAAPVSTSLEGNRERAERRTHTSA